MDIVGVTPGSYCIDMLHSWALGPVLKLIAFTFWLFLEHNVWGQAIPWLGVDEIRQLGVLRLRAEMWLFYQKRRRDDPTWAEKGSEVFFISLCVFRWPN